MGLWHWLRHRLTQNRVGPVLADQLQQIVSERAADRPARDRERDQMLSDMRRFNERMDQMGRTKRG